MRRSKQQRGLAWLLAFVMILSTVVSAPDLSLNAQAASAKYVKSLSVKKNVSVEVGSKTTVKPKIKVANKASTKVKVKVKNSKIAKASYSSKSKKITIQGKRAGRTKVTVTTVAKNKKGKKISKTINVKVTQKSSPTTTTEKPASIQPTTEKPATTAATEQGTTEQGTTVEVQTPVPGDIQSTTEQQATESQGTTEQQSTASPATTEQGTTARVIVPATTEERTTEEKTTETTTIPVESITLSKETVSLSADEEVSLSAKISPDDATNKEVVWTVDSENVVSISDNGLEATIKAIAVGTATITVAAQDDSGVTATCTVNVVETLSVASQGDLEEALQNPTAGKIILDTEAGETYTIPTGEYPNVELVISGEGATVTNEGEFKSVTLNGGTYVEKATGNPIYVTASSDITISEKASASIDVNIQDNSEAGESEENERPSVNIVNNGTLEQLNIVSGADVTVSGTGTKVIPTNITAKDVKLTTNQNMDLRLTETAELVFQTAGVGTETTISVDKTEHKPVIKGVGQYTIIYDDGTSEVVMPKDSGDNLSVADLYGTVMDASERSALEGVSVYLIPASLYKSEMSEQDGSIETENGVEDSTEGENEIENPIEEESEIDPTEIESNTEDSTETGSDTEDSTEAEIGIRSVITDTNGEYTFGETKSGNYYLIMSKDGYKKATQFLAVSSSDEQGVEVETMELLKSGLEEDFRGYLSGKVVDEADGDGISGLTVELRRHKGITTGTAIATVTSGADGTYEFDDLDVDQYTLRVVDNRNNAKSKYATCSVNVCVNSVSTEKNITTSATSDSDEIRFVLKWGEGDDAPKDLDSYLYGPRVNDLGTFELSYGQYYGIAGKTYAKVIADSSSHKETATIVEPTDGIYYYYVYCSSDDENTPMFDTSDAVVEVYAGTELLETYNVPVDGNSTDCWWSVCSYDSRTGQLTSGDGLMEYKPAFGILYSGYENLVTKVYSSKSSCLKDDETQIDAPDYTGVGNIYLYGDESWSVVEDTLQYDTVSGYTAEFNEESEPTDEDYYVGKILVKDENGDVVNSYKLYYEKVVELSVVGDYKSYGIARIDIDGKYMAIFMPKAPDNKAEIMDELEFKCSDSSYTSFDYDSGTGVLSVSDGLNPKYFYVSFESNYYITDVKSSGESIEYCEYSKMMNIVAPTPESTDNLQVECVAGYSAEIISEGNTVFKLKITTDDELGESDPVIKDVDFTGVVESAVKLTVEDYSELGVTRVVINDDANSVKIYVPDTNVDDVNELINTLPFGASDESYEVTVPDLEEPTLRLSDGDSTVDYSVECITGCYITDVWDSQGVVTKWEEDSDHLEIYVDTTENDISDIEGTIELYFDCVDGYKVEIDDEDDTLLNITNVQSGDVIEKHFSLAPNNG